MRVRDKRMGCSPHTGWNRPTQPHAGIHTGDVDVTVTPGHRRPQRRNAEWEEIVEVSLRSAKAEAQVVWVLPQLNRLTDAPPGTASGVSRVGCGWSPGR